MSTKKHWIPVILCVAAIALIATGCGTNVTPSPSPTMKATTAVTIAPTVAPTMSAIASPSPTMMASPSLMASPTMTASPAAEAAAEPANKAEKLSGEIVKIGEIQKSTVLISGDTCLVGVEFIPGYTGGLTDAMKSSITQLAAQVDSSLKNCAVTADAALYARIRDIAGDIYQNSNTTAAIAEFNEMTGQLLPKGA